MPACVHDLYARAVVANVHPDMRAKNTSACLYVCVCVCVCVFVCVLCNIIYIHIPTTAACRRREATSHYPGADPPRSTGVELSLSALYYAALSFPGYSSASPDTAVPQPLRL